PRPGPTDSLEAKLRQGISRPDVLRHPFHNETMNLSVSFPDARAQEAAEDRMLACMAGNHIRPLEEAIVDPAQSIPKGLRFFVAGLAHRNFGESNDDRQWLVRLPVSELAALVQEVGTSCGGRLELQIGGSIVASTSDQVHEVLRASTFQEQLAAAQEPASTTQDSRGQVYGRVGPRSHSKGITQSGPKDAAPAADRGPDQEPSTPRRAALPTGEPTGETDAQPTMDAAEEIVTVIIHLRVP
ncbi:MAG: hypothetical protein V2A79_05665, partial [Planctomycetota bacterium]